MDQDKYIEVVGAYLDKELQGEELKQFENELSKNPELKKELSFQKDLLEGIKQNRHNQLKARLDNLDVSGGNTGTSTAVKVVGGIAIASLIGLGIYMNSDSPEPDTTTETTEVIQDSPTEDLTSTSPVEENNLNESTESIDAESSESVEPQEEQVISRTEAENSEDENILDESIPVAEIPEADTEMDNMEAMEDVDISTPTISMDKSVSSGQSNISVEVMRKKKYDFHYEFTEDRMVLYGKFNDEPYELIEVNLADGKKIFLSYKSDYYAIEPTTEITPLKVITDQSLIQKIKDIDK